MSYNWKPPKGDSTATAPSATTPTGSTGATTEKATPEAGITAMDPFSDSDWTWLNGNPHTRDSPLDSKYFSGEFRADAYYAFDFNHPIDDSIGGSSELFRSQELQLEQISIGGDLHVDNVRGRILLLMGEFATGTPCNDASPARGQWELRNAIPLCVGGLRRLPLEYSAWGQC